SAQCPSHWNAFQGSCYLFIDENVVWTSALSEGNWVLASNKEPPAYTNWRTGEPNNDNPAEGGQDCAYIRTDGLWDDDGCDKGNVFHAVGCETSPPTMIILGLIFMLFVPGSARCPNDWTRFEDSCYVFIDENVPWTSAAVICRLVLGADMLEIETQAENDFIASQIFARNGVDNIWIGLTDFTREGRWEWTSTKEQPSFTNWGPGQPDNLGIAEKGQDCAYIRPDGSWDDESCDHNVVTHSVACET
ncbi:hypothetical protein BaRGS_00032383, partial [Batillaria attramentaria]